MNMAIDEVLFRAVASRQSLPVLRLYGWLPSTVTLGYGQRGCDEVNLDFCARQGIDVVRRITGGRAVLHDREVTYAVISSSPTSIFPGDVLGDYRVIAAALQATIRAFGVEAQLSSGSMKAAATAVERSACFTAPASYELVYQGCKLTGCAQKRGEGAFLQHGSIPVDLDPALLFAALDTQGQTAPAVGSRLLERKVGWLNRWRRTAARVEEVEQELLRQCSSAFEAEFIEQDLTSEERALAVRLAEVKYSCLDWHQISEDKRI